MEKLIIHCDEKPVNGMRVVIDGVEYMSGGDALARELGVTKSEIQRACEKDFPRVSTNYKYANLYPLEDCRKWVAEHRKPAEIVLDGKLYVNKSRIAALLGEPVSAVEKWQRKSGMPWLALNRHHRVYPVEDCRAWYAAYKQTPEYYRRLIYAHARKAAESLCNICDNAYAHKCCWFKDYTPVDGWTAKKVPFWGTAYSFTYCVKDCPNFIPDPPRPDKAW